MTRRFDILLPDDEPPTHAPWCWREDWYAPGESSLALLAKFQRLNALSCAALLDAFAYRDARQHVPQNLDLRDARRFDVLRMMSVLRLRLTDVAAAFIMPSHRLGRIAFATLRWCPKCSLEGVHLSAFQYRTSEQCPIRRVRLSQHCEQCGAMIPYRLRPDLFRSPFNCPSCAHPWFLPTQGPDNLRVGRAYRGLLRERSAHRLPAIRTEDQGPVHFRLPPASAWTVFVGSDAIDGEATPDDMAPEEGGSAADCGDALAYECYKAVRRWIMRVYGRGHRACIATAARHLTWSLTGSNTTSFCPIAQAYLRWRCKWEGFGTPSTLLQRPLHGPLGLAVWLSLYAPVAQRTWSHTASRWITLHLLGRACVDSFRTFLAEAEQLQMNRRTLWLPFPVHDFPRRQVVGRGGNRPGQPISFCVSMLNGADVDGELVRVSAGRSHRRTHFEGLRRNVDFTHASRSSSRLQRDLVSPMAPLSDTCPADDGIWRSVPVALDLASL